VLPDDVDGTGDGFAVVFNETMNPDEVDENSVIIWNEGPDPGTSSTAMADDEYLTDFTATMVGNALHIVTTEPLGDDDHLKIYMLSDDFQDTSGNYLTGPDLVDDDTCENKLWVEDFWSSNDTKYIVVGVKIFSPDSTNVGEVTDLAQVCLDEGGPDGFPALNAAYPSVFSDMDSSTPGFQNLNTTLNDSYWAERLEALAQAGGNNANVDNGYALVTFLTPTEGTYSVSPGGCSGTNDGTTKSCTLSGVSVGQTVYVTSEDDFGNPSNVVSIVLGDCAAPTTVLNYAYNTCGHVGYSPVAGAADGTLGGYDTNYAAHICTVGEILGDPAYGDGGENTEEAEASVLGLPTLNITCRLLKDADIAPSVIEPIDIFGLYGQIDTYPLDPDPTNADELYDATAFAGWQPFADTIGVAFSEDIVMTAGGSIVSPTLTTTITSWAVGNNITQQDDLDPIDANANGNAADLAQITVDDVIDLANVDHGEVIDFSAAVEDVSGNAADNARVVVNDLLPPFVVSAYWDGDLVIEFNEPVNVCTDATECTTTTITLMDPTYGGNVAYTTPTDDAVITTDGASLSVDGMTLTIPSSTMILAPTNFDRSLHFPSQAITGNLVYSESIYDTILTTPLADYAHGRLNFDNIEDMNGNRWLDWDGATDGSNANINAATDDFVASDWTGSSAMCNTPEFAPVDALGPFIITSIPVTMAPGDPVGRFGVVYTFSLPIDYGDLIGTFPGCTGANNTAVCANNWLQTPGNLASVSTLTLAAGGAVATTGSSYNDLTRTLNLVFEPGSGIWSSGDTIEFSTGWRFISSFGGNSRTLNNHTIE
jgi:hypothetical protein